jgi:[phosphatase 2A protein]-leucine-carboxy methyltransferase
MEDKFITHFGHYSPDASHHRRDPEISRGYWARTAAISSLATQFIAAAGPSAQIVSLGSGFDTLYWRLRDAGLVFRKYVELDFSSVTSKKMRLIRRVAKPGATNLTSYFDQPGIY